MRLSARDICHAPRHTVSVVLAGGRGTRLMDLTRDLSKPGLDFGGKYRIIDFTLSNCVNSGFRRMLVLTQYNSHRLLEHLQFGWTFLPSKLDEFVHVLPAQQSMERDVWYSGTADAVYQNIPNIQAHDPRHVLILAGDHVYKMDYRIFLEDHIEQDADMTIACLEVPEEEAKAFGVVEVDKDDRVVDFKEKVPNPPCVPGKPGVCFASMGIYLVKADFLYRELMRDAEDPMSTHDFGKDIIPHIIDKARVYAHRYERSCIPNQDKPAYWRDVGTVDAYWEANLDLTHVRPELNLYEEDWPIFTHQEQLPGAKFVHSAPAGFATNTVLSGGCIVSGAHVDQSLLFSKVHVHSHAKLTETVVLPGSDIGRGARLTKCVVARGTHVPPGLVVGENPELDARRFYRTQQGITLISPKMLERLDCVGE